MHVLLQPLQASEGGSVQVTTNSKEIPSSLISSYCAHKGIRFERKYTIYDDQKRPLPLYTTLGALGIQSGQTLLIGKEDSSVLQQWPIIVALATIAIGFIGILTISLVYGLKGGEYFDDYGVVMDAGSSKTNTIVYKWRSNKHRGTGRVSQTDFCNAAGGIAKMNPMKLDAVFDCVKNVTEVIEPKSIPKTPLFFAATAGMRLLSLTDPNKVDQILKQLNLHLPETNLSVKTIEIISGRDEGIYGWITSNFLLKKLDTPQTLEPTTYGALDMGGASMQISYAVPPSSHLTDVVDVQLYGQTFNVFSQSNLCFGRDEAENRYRALLQSQANGTVINSPCTPRGYNETLTGAQLFKPICANYTRSKEKGDIQNINFTFVGTSNPQACQKSVTQLLDNDLCKKLKFKECFKNITSPPANQKFLAFATYFYATDFLNVTSATLDIYKEKMDDFCSKSYDQIKKPNDSYVTQHCFNAQYVYEVLTNGFGFTAETWKNIEFVKKIDGKDVGWTLGYMINATNIIPEKATPRLISSASLTVSLVLFILIILATALFLLYTYKKNASKDIP